MSNDPIVLQLMLHKCAAVTIVFVAVGAAAAAAAAVVVVDSLQEWSWSLKSTQ